MERKPIEIDPIEFERLAKEFQRLELLYRSALREICTKLEILNDELSLRGANPIEHIKSRVKSPRSIAEKLMRKGLPVSMESAKAHLTDVAGVRLICSFIDDIYAVSDMLTKQNDVTLIRVRDYIKEPKANGYRSLHLVVEIPVFFSNAVERVPVEVQIRTVAMDFWASLEHKLRYKKDRGNIPGLSEDLLLCAEQISLLDDKMMDINRRIMGPGEQERTIS